MATAVFGQTPPPSPTPSPTPAVYDELSADQIMINAEKATRKHDLTRPPFITYQMHEVFLHLGGRSDYDYRVWYRTSDGKGLMQSTHKERSGDAETHFGYPFPSSPDNNILLYATAPPDETPAPAIGSPSPLPSGATPPPLLSVQPVAGDRYYSVKLAGIEDLDGKQVYHLTLRALHDERTHPWKDVWVDVKTFEVWKAYAEVSGTKGIATGKGNATVVFAPVGDHWLVSSAVGDGSVRIGPLGDSGHYEYTFSDYGFPDSVPDWYFDPKLFKQHH